MSPLTLKWDKDSRGIGAGWSWKGTYKGVYVMFIQGTWTIDFTIEDMKARVSSMYPRPVETVDWEDIRQQLTVMKAQYRLIGDAVLQTKESNDENA